MKAAIERTKQTVKQQETDWQMQKQRLLDIAKTAHACVPPLWLPQAAWTLAEGNVWPGLWGGAGLFLLGSLGLARAYRSTMRFYLGQEAGRGGKSRAKVRPKAAPGRNWLELRLPGVPEEVAGLALAQARSMARAPEVKMAVAMNFFLAIFFPAMLFWRAGAHVGDAGKPFIATAAVALVFFGMMQLLLNQFGYDRDGFRAMVLLPTLRHRVLLGKNLALLPIAAGTAVFFLGCVACLAKLPAIVVIAAPLQFIAAFLLLCLAGDLFSVLAPFRVAAGSLKPTKPSVVIVLLMVAATLLYPVAVSPIFLPPALGWALERLGWLPAAPVNLAASAVLAALTAALYRVTIRSLGRLLQRREIRILDAVTVAAE